MVVGVDRAFVHLLSQCEHLHWLMNWEVPTWASRGVGWPWAEGLLGGSLWDCDPATTQRDKQQPARSMAIQSFAIHGLCSGVPGSQDPGAPALLHSW